MPGECLTMRRFYRPNIKNTPEEYARILAERDKKPVDWADHRRWEFMLKYYRGGKLMDLGCLDSEVALMAKDRFPEAEVWGLDSVPEVAWRMDAKNPNVNWLIGDVYHTHFPKNYFDYLVAGELIEHLEDPEAMIHEAMRVLKRGGTLAISTPLEETEAGEVDGERHLWSFTKEDFDVLLGKYGDTTVRILRSQYFPKYKYHFPTVVGFCHKAWFTKQK